MDSIVIRGDNVINALWCAPCWPERVAAHFIIHGVSICEVCFQREYDEVLKRREEK